jgi:hypothetical protein
MKIFLWIIGGAVILCAALGIIYIAALSRIHLKGEQSNGRS